MCWRQTSDFRGADLFKVLGAAKPESPSNREIRHAENMSYPGGMRNPGTFVAQHPLYQGVGSSMFDWMRDQIHRVADIYIMVDTLRAGNEIKPLADEVMEPLRHNFLSFMGSHRVSSEPTIPTMLRALGSSFQDMDLSTHIADWLSPSLGAPLGFNNDIPTLGIFPPVDPSSAPGASAESLISDMHE